MFGSCPERPVGRRPLAADALDLARERRPDDGDSAAKAETGGGDEAHVADPRVRQLARPSPMDGPTQRGPVRRPHRRQVVPSEGPVLAAASILLALCDMRTLYLRNVPDEVGARLEALAAREGLSLSAFATRELSVLARRADNPALLAGLPDLKSEAEGVVVDIEDGRKGR